MNICEIERLAYLFRQGADRAKTRGDFDEQPFNDFPNACCGDVPELVAQFLLDYDNTLKCRYVYGQYNYDDFDHKYGHAWLEVNDSIIVDIAADQRQFRDAEIFPVDATVPCYVGKKNAFYSLFEEAPRQSYRFYDLRQHPPVAYNRMKKLFDIITSCINE